MGEKKEKLLRRDKLKNKIFLKHKLSYRRKQEEEEDRPRPGKPAISTPLPPLPSHPLGLGTLSFAHKISSCTHILYFLLSLSLSLSLSLFPNPSFLYTKNTFGLSLSLWYYRLLCSSPALSPPTHTHPPTHTQEQPTIWPDSFLVWTHFVVGPKKRTPDLFVGLDGRVPWRSRF
jgi:hypothetical protein